MRHFQLKHMLANLNKYLRMIAFWKSQSTLFPLTHPEVAALPPPLSTRREGKSHACGAGGESRKCEK